MKLEYYKKHFDLASPYKLSFKTLDSFISHIIFVESDGRSGAGEAVALFGYNNETDRSIEKAIRRIIKGTSLDEIRSLAMAESEDNPFAASAVLTAIDTLSFNTQSNKEKISVHSPIATDKVAELSGHKYFKIKTGANFDQDIENLPEILKQPFKFTLDANKAYRFEQALKIVNILKEFDDKYLWLEQPCGAYSWNDHKRLIEQTGARIMLDESIYSLSDLNRAKEIGAYGVKLKLFKHAGLYGTLELAKKSKELGLVCTLGNGVSGPIGNYLETLLFEQNSDLFTLPFESNGFSKIKDQSSFPIKEENGSVFITSEFNFSFLKNS